MIWDSAVVVGFLGLALWIAYRAGPAQSSEEFFWTGGLPWWACCFSFVAAEVSVVTLVGLPANSYRGGWLYVQFFLGSALARACIALRFVPVFCQPPPATIYEFLGRRFGKAARYIAAGLFLAARLLGCGVRLTLAVMAIKIFLGWPFPVLLALLIIVAGLIAGYGGAKAVAWVSLLQISIFFAGSLGTLVYLSTCTEGGMTTLLSIAAQAGKFESIDFEQKFKLGQFLLNPALPVAATVIGFFSALAALGTDQEMMQRLLIARDPQAAGRAAWGSIAVSFALLALLLLIGTGLFAFYRLNPGMSMPVSKDKVFLHFAATLMPVGLRGLVVAAIAMAAINLSLASLATVLMTDFYFPLRGAAGEEKRLLEISRLTVAVFAVLIGAIACLFGRFSGSVPLALRFGGIALGPLLGIFLFGLLTLRRGGRAGVVAMVLLVLADAGCVYFLPIDYGWLIVLATAATFFLAWRLAC